MYALLAYVGAIIIKVIFQAFTATSVISYFGYTSVATGLYYGIQTSVLEVGLAYVVANYARRKKMFVYSDAEGYGLSLSFWENAALLGFLPLISLLSSYLSIAYGGADLSSVVRDTLLESKPSLFSGTVAALPSIGLSILERVSSLLAHFSWGFLVLVSAFTGKRVYLAIALPMGLIDALVPFASTIGLVRFEVILFLITLVFLAITLIVRRKEKVPSKNAGGNVDA